MGNNPPDATVFITVGAIIASIIILALIIKRVFREEKKKLNQVSFNAFETFITHSNPDHPATTFAQNRRTIICHDVAVITVANPPGLASVAALFREGKEANQLDEQIGLVLGAVLKSNPKADLTEYEKTFNINIIKVEILKSPTQGGDIYG